MNKIIQGSSLEVLKTLDEKSIDMCMTSPPYWSLRDYGVEGQLGLEPTFDQYISDLCDIFEGVKRVLKDEGTCWVNLGDTYYGGGQGGGGKQSKVEYPRVWKRPSREAFSEAGIDKNCLECGSEIKTGINGQFCSRDCLNKQGNDFRSQNRLLPDKCLVMIPMRFAIEMINRGWILRNTIIWHKPNCMPSSVTDRFTVDFEYIFFFSKKKKYYFETQRENRKYDFDKSIKYDQKGNPTYKAKVTKEDRNKIRNRGIKEGFRFDKSYNNPLGRIKRTVWKITTRSYPEAHFATYPEELCETPIKAGCPEGGIVLDPFFGAGTTGLVALKQNKKFLGIELNPEYIEIAEKRLKPYLEQEKLFTTHKPSTASGGEDGE